MEKGSDYIKKLVGSNLRALREQRQLTQDGLAALIGVTGRTIMNIENAVTFPKPLTIYSISNLFGISPAELFLPETKNGNGLDDMQKEILIRELGNIKEAIDMLFLQKISEQKGEE